MTNDDTTNRQPPIQTLRDGTVSITLWERQPGTKTFITASIRKDYQDRDGKWRESRSLGDTDLLKLQTLIPQAREEIKRWQEQQRSQSHEQKPEHAAVQDMQAERDTALQAARAAKQNAPKRDKAPQRSR